MADEGGAFAPDGPVAAEIADLWWVMLAVGTLVFLLYAVPLVVALFRRRPQEGDDGEDGGGADRSPAGAGAMRAIVAGGVLMPTVVLVGIWGFTIETMEDLPERGGEDALVVEVVGHQWWWEFRYPEAGVVTANELHLPVGREIELRMTSADVIHSFWVPPLAGKMDLLPEDLNVLVLQGDEVGEYLGACAEFCGVAHALMYLRVVVEPEAAWEAWIDGQQTEAAEPSTPAERAGREVFLEAGCGTCHTVRGTPADGGDAPDLTHLASRGTIGAGTLTTSPADLADWLRDPESHKPGVLMPPAELPPDELDDLVAYLGSLT